MTQKKSTGQITLLTVVELFLFFTIWINIYIAPIYLIVHGLMVFGLVKMKNFYSTLSPTKFGLLICGLPLGLLLIQNIFTIPLYVMANGELGEILAVTGLTLIVTAVDFAITYFIYNKWWTSVLKESPNR